MATSDQPPPAATTVYTTTTTTSTTTSTHDLLHTTTSHATTAAGPPRLTVTSSDAQSTTLTHPPVTTTTTTTTQQSPAPAPAPADSAPHTPASTTQPERQPSIRLQRQAAAPSDDAAPTNRRRSSSEPQRPPQALLGPQDDLEIRRQLTATPTPLQTLHEEGSGRLVPQLLAVPPAAGATNSSRQRPGFNRQTSAISLRPRGHEAREYTPHMVDVLDVIDPEVSTLTTLNNVQNSLFLPNLGWLYNRQPTYNLSRSSPDTSDEEKGDLGAEAEKAPPVETEVPPTGARAPRDRLARTDTISSVLTSMSEGHNYAVLPHGASLPGWTAEDKAALNDHVRHLLHSRRAKFRRSMRGFARYLRKPVGFLVSLYAFLITFWGAAWVLFIIGWISVGDRQSYLIEICDQVLVALFCVVGIGFAPWRAVDTYHMIYVAHYAHRTWRVRKERGLPALKDHNELPARPSTHAWETGEDAEPKGEEIVLTASQQQKLEHHQSKLAKSHTFYKPHETTTHRAFSLRLLIAVIVLLDCHSLFQMALGATTWGIYYKHRPKALTAVILTCSICSNISAGITISIGDRKSRKKLVVEQMFRQTLTEEALDSLKKKRGLKVKGAKKNKSLQADKQQ